MSPIARAFASAASFAAWLVLLFFGHIFGGFVHLLFLAGVLLFPRAARAGAAPRGGERG